MSFFLFVKQIVDMLYMYKILDYGMVFLILVLLIYQILLIRPSVREFYKKTDSIVIAFSILLTINFLKNISEYETYFKVLSALLMYFVGRIYYERIQECYTALVSSSYLIIYLNFFHRLKNFGSDFLKVSNAEGDLYFYDTDMAFAIILAFIFIVMFGRNTLFRLVTIIVICPYMVFFSDAGIQKILMIAIVGIIGIYIMELGLRKVKFSNFILVTMVIGMVGVVLLIYLPLIGLNSSDISTILFNNAFLDYGNMDARYHAWSEILKMCENSTALELLFGHDLQLQYSHGIYGESLYLKIFYSMGWTGILLSLIMILYVAKCITKNQDRKTFYLMVMMLIMLLGTGVTMNSMERVQMSWFPWMFAGMVISSVNEESKRGDI